MKNLNSYILAYLRKAQLCIEQLDTAKIDLFVHDLLTVRINKKRLFLLGVGGSAANCSHAVNDFRKLCGIEAYTPLDNAAELTARINDDGWYSVFANWLQVSRLGAGDVVMFLSVGGGDREKNISVNLIEAANYAVSVGAECLSIVARGDSYLAKYTTSLVIPTTELMRTPIAEAMQMVILHCIVTHPALQLNPCVW